MEKCKELCAGFDTRSCHIYKNREGKPGVYCDAAHPCLGRPTSEGAVGYLGATPLAGRSPASLPSGADEVVEHLLLARLMEAQSVDAFRELEKDLVRFGAPASLRRACRRAAVEEARHARAMTRLLRRRGAATPRLRRANTPGFSTLRALALHNEREGVVGETWGALVAAHQAQHAVDHDLRDAMQTIAREETSHAALSFRIAAWARTRLPARDVRTLDRARRQAYTKLRRTLGHRPAAAADPLGWPSVPASAVMIDALAPLL
jgi:hypothetical protein